MPTKRLDHIDFLRAITIIGIIAVHTLQYDLNSPLITFIWNYLHFDVVAFVFCSGYVLTARYQDSVTSLSKTISWIGKRMIRLIIPFYIYLAAHYILWFLFPHYFSGLGLQKSVPFLVSSIIFIGGIDINWLPLLFLQLTLLFPLFMIGLKKKTPILSLFVFVSLCITLYFTIVPFPYAHYRTVMWIPWSLVLLLSMKTAMKERQNNSRMRNYVLISLLGFVVFSIISFIWAPAHQHVRLIDHKYPPDFYYLSYATGTTFLILLIGKFNFLYIRPFQNVWKYISIHSYQLFFLHYIVLDVFRTGLLKSSFQLNPIVQFVIVLIVSLLLSLTIAQLGSIKKNLARQLNS